MTQEETIEKIIEMADSIGEECIHDDEKNNYGKYVSYDGHPKIKHLEEEFDSIIYNFIVTEDYETRIGNKMEFNKYPNNKYLLKPFGWISGVVLIRKEDNALIYAYFS